MIELIDNFLPEDIFTEYQSEFFGKNIPWRRLPHVSIEGGDDGQFFTHNIYDNFVPESADAFNRVKKDVLPLIPDIKALLRVRVNLHPATSEVYQHGWHYDYEFEAKGLVLSMNTCDGYTVFPDGTKVENVANRACIFNSHEDHASTTCTDQQCRIVLVVNWI